MSILTQLYKLNISNKDLVNLTDKEIIRIEKKLKAEVKMGGSLDINEVNSIIKLLKDNKEELQLFLDEKYSWFRKIVTNPDQLIVFPLTHAGLLNLDDKLKEFISTNFKTELTKYSALCLFKNHYRALNSFLAYSPVIPDSILEDIQLKMIQKLEYGIECIDINVNELEKKVIHLFNPFFFRCINFLENIHFEDLMNDLTNSLVENLKKNKQLVRALFSAGAFRSSDTELKSVISQNRSYAIDRGVGELTNFKKHPKGGTTSKKFGGDFNGSNLIWIIVVMLIFVFRIGRTCNDKQPKYEFDQTKFLESIEKYKVNTDNKLEKFKENVLFLQSDDIKKISEEITEFNEENINYKLSFSASMSSNYFTEVFNKTEQPVLFVYEVYAGVKYLCIEPNTSIETYDIFKKFLIYTGQTPMLVNYLDGFGNENYGFKFKKFDEEDLKHLNTTINKSNYNSVQNNYEIIISSESVKINEKS